MPDYRCRVSLPYITSLPTDVSVNDFSIEADNDTVLGNALANIEDFYNVNIASSPLSDWYSQLVSRATDACTIAAYDRAAGPGAGPHMVRNFTLGPAAGAPIDGLPEEVALVLSFHADLSGTVNKRRRRGRVFLGPFTVAANDPTPGFGSQVDPNLITAMTEVAANLEATTSNPATAGDWQVWSGVDATGYPVVGGWVDDAWDTMRSRGREQPTRTIWP